QPVARWLGARVSWDEAWDGPVAFLLTAVVAGLVIQLLGEALLRRVSEKTHRGGVNRTLGMIPGLGGGLISAAILGVLVMAAPAPRPRSADARTGQSGARGRRARRARARPGVDRGGTRALDRHVRARLLRARLAGRARPFRPHEAGRRHLPRGGREPRACADR